MKTFYSAFSGEGHGAPGEPTSKKPETHATRSAFNTLSVSASQNSMIGDPAQLM
jgi:hypothetical protein